MKNDLRVSFEFHCLRNLLLLCLLILLHSWASVCAKLAFCGTFYFHIAHIYVCMDVQTRFPTYRSRQKRNFFVSLTTILTSAAKQSDFAHSCRPTHFLHITVGMRGGPQMQQLQVGEEWVKVRTFNIKIKMQQSRARSFGSLLSDTKICMHSHSYMKKCLYLWVCVCLVLGEDASIFVRIKFALKLYSYFHAESIWL